MVVKRGFRRESLKDAELLIETLAVYLNPVPKNRNIVGNNVPNNKGLDSMYRAPPLATRLPHRIVACFTHATAIIILAIGAGGTRARMGLHVPTADVT
jgi:hypothetical protein